MPRALKVCRVHSEGFFGLAEMVYASNLRRLPYCGALGNTGHRYRARLTKLNITSGGIRVVFLRKKISIPTNSFFFFQGPS